MRFLEKEFRKTFIEQQLLQAQKKLLKDLIERAKEDSKQGCLAMNTVVAFAIRQLDSIKDNPTREIYFSVQSALYVLKTPGLINPYLLEEQYPYSKEDDCCYIFYFWSILLRAVGIIGNQPPKVLPYIFLEKQQGYNTHKEENYDAYTVETLSAIHDNTIMLVKAIHRASKLDNLSTSNKYYLNNIAQKSVAACYFSMKKYLQLDDNTTLHIREKINWDEANHGNIQKVSEPKISEQTYSKPLLMRQDSCGYFDDTKPKLKRQLTPNIS